ncbi:paraquat-inducible protein A [Bacteroides sp. 519]|uniref:paraquat-inducible protein A n=1 Tax=Bacteroides sp. 519 TaxID=2302937 RepID=UPI0013D00484|nr:paraquat-inducible protein A [Bacteroides sp. 519]NDV58674.1 hypothetical protein [Bacteroides sp. 519]
MTKDIKRILGTITLCVSFIFFVLGVYYPLFSTATKIVFKFRSNDMNLFDSVKFFFDNNEYFLAIIILFFTFIMPLLKYIELTITVIRNKAPRFSHALDKWNMLDVFLVALLLLNFKMNSNIIVMDLKIGTTFIALAVIFRIISISFLVKHVKH